MNKEEPSFGEVEETSDETVDEKAEESTVSLSQYEKIKDDYLRLAADFDNYKKRAEKEKENIETASIAYFVNAIFPLIDNFEMAMAQEKVAKEVTNIARTTLVVIFFS